MVFADNISEALSSV